MSDFSDDTPRTGASATLPAGFFIDYSEVER